ncbi:ABC1 kinase family protein [Enterovirga sp. CN4-39]|uniref:ABC1 kinase family protein n=1 Tax=Enterovirga sp. CN4-39 TaxID=3400910 RepID=UPI003C0E7957
MLKSAFAAARDRQRLQQIVGVLIAYGVTNVVDKLGLRAVAPLARWRTPAVDVSRLSQPERVRRAIETLGPTFIKLGQILASRTDLLPPAWTNELGKLHSQVAPLPWDDMAPQLEAALGCPPEDIFAEFDRNAIASASIAQVYRARLMNGDDVVVKVLRPGLRPTIEADLRLLGHATSLVERQWPELTRYKPQEQLKQLATGIAGELDLMSEGTNCELLASIFPDSEDVIFPKIYWEYTSEQVIVQEYIDGIPPTDKQRVREAGLDPAALAQNITNAFLHMALVEGVFHADPHPGNLLALPGNRIAYLDFGLVGRLTERRRSQLLILIGAMLKQDADGLMGVLLAWTGATNPDLTKLDAAAHNFVVRHSKKPLNIGLVLEDFMTMARENDLAMPTDLAILFKALITWDGVMRQLDPSFDLFAAAAPTVQRKMKARFSFSGFRHKAEQLGASMFGAATELPSLIHLMLVRLKQGKVTVEIEIKGIDKLTNGIERAAARVSIAIVVAAFAIQVAPRLVDLGTPFFAVVTALIAIFGIGWVLLLRRNKI